MAEAGAPAKRTNKIIITRVGQKAFCLRINKTLVQKIIINWAKIDMCNPEIAKIWEIPDRLNQSLTSWGTCRFKPSKEADIILACGSLK